jgi:hypothetical protein
MIILYLFLNLLILVFYNHQWLFLIYISVYNYQIILLNIGVKFTIYI